MWYYVMFAQQHVTLFHVLQSVKDEGGQQMETPMI